MSDVTIWWVICVLLVVAELATGTFYLLMLALGVAAGAVAGHLGAGMVGQLVTAAVVGSGAVATWHRRRTRSPATPVSANRDVNLDVGEPVRVDLWSADGTARVRYRGAEWQARWAGGGPPATGELAIRAIEGSVLMLDRA